MKSLAKAVINFVRREDGLTPVEYAVMLAVITVICIPAVTALGSNANKTFTTINHALGSAS
jgi:pilus assembly protein Flp/PilA